MQPRAGHFHQFFFFRPKKGSFALRCKTKEKRRPAGLRRMGFWGNKERETKMGRTNIRKEFSERSRANRAGISEFLETCVNIESVQIGIIFSYGTRDKTYPSLCPPPEGHLCALERAIRLSSFRQVISMLSISLSL